MDEGDDINNYQVILKKHINRMQVAEKVITELKPKMTQFHEKVLMARAHAGAARAPAPLAKVVGSAPNHSPMHAQGLLPESISPR